MAKAWASAFYHSPQWQAVRRIVLHRDHYTCCDCGERANEVHHIVELTPDNINDPNIALNPDNLMSLCGRCHKRRTHSEGDAGDGYAFGADGQVNETRGYPPMQKAKW